METVDGDDLTQSAAKKKKVQKKGIAQKVKPKPARRGTRYEESSEEEAGNKPAKGKASTGRSPQLKPSFVQLRRERLMQPQRSQRRATPKNQGTMKWIARVWMALTALWKCSLRRRPNKG